MKTSILTLVAMMISAGAFTACGKQLQESQRSSGSETEAKGAGDAKGRQRLALDLPEDMKKDDSAVDVEEWAHYDEIKETFGSEMELICDGEKIEGKRDLKGKVRGVFEVTLYRYAVQEWAPSFPEADEDEPSAVNPTDEEIVRKKAQLSLAHDEKDKGEEGVETEEAADEKHAEEDADGGLADGAYSETVSHFSFPYTCEGNASLQLSLDEGEAEFVIEANLLTPDLEVAYTGATKFMSYFEEIPVLVMQKYQEAASRVVDIEVLFEDN